MLNQLYVISLRAHYVQSSKPDCPIASSVKEAHDSTWRGGGGCQGVFETVETKGGFGIRNLRFFQPEPRQASLVNDAAISPFLTFSKVTLVQ